MIDLAGYLGIGVLGLFYGINKQFIMAAIIQQYFVVNVDKVVLDALDFSFSVDFNITNEGGNSSITQGYVTGELSIQVAGESFQQLLSYVNVINDDFFKNKKRGVSIVRGYNDFFNLNRTDTFYSCVLKSISNSEQVIGSDGISAKIQTYEMVWVFKNFLLFSADKDVYSAS